MALRYICQKHLHRVFFNSWASWLWSSCLCYEHIWTISVCLTGPTKVIWQLGGLHLLNARTFDFMFYWNMTLKCVLYSESNCLSLNYEVLHFWPEMDTWTSKCSVYDILSTQRHMVCVCDRTCKKSHVLNTPLQLNCRKPVRMKMKINQVFLKVLWGKIADCGVLMVASIHLIECLWDYLLCASGVHADPCCPHTTPVIALCVPWKTEKPQAYTHIPTHDELLCLDFVNQLQNYNCEP